MKRLLLIAVTLCFSSLVKANEFDAYVGLGVGQLTYDTEFNYTVGVTEYEVSEKPQPAALYFKVGGYLENNFGLEGRFAFGLTGYGESDTIEVTDDADNVVAEIDTLSELETLLGLYLTYRMGIGDSSSVYGLFGASMGAINLINEATGGKLARADDTTWSYGVGLNFLGFNIEAMSYMHREDYDVTAINVGYMFQF